MNKALLLIAFFAIIIAPPFLGNGSEIALANTEATGDNIVLATADSEADRIKKLLL